MKSLMIMAVVLSCAASVVVAGPNAGGAIVAHDASLAFTTDNTTSYCGQGVLPSSCAAIDAELDGSGPGTVQVWKVYAVFYPGGAPRLKAMTFGIHYPAGASGIHLGFHGPCIGDLNSGASEFPGAGWPGTDTGTTIVWQYTQTTYLTECYWFAGYTASALSRNVFQLRDHPDPNLGGRFSDDSVPALLDPIVCYGSLGFDTPGTLCCAAPGACCRPDGSCFLTWHDQCQPPDTWNGAAACNPNPCPPPSGACCYPDGSCTMSAPDGCQAPNQWQGPGTTCVPNPCPQPPPQCRGGVFTQKNPYLKPAGTIGRGRGIMVKGGERDCQGSLVLNFDGSAENAYCWQYAGIAPPYCGAFAECYSGTGDVCGVQLKLTGIGYPCTSCDLFLWADAGGRPGAVLTAINGYIPCPVATWPNVSTHNACVPMSPVNGPFWVGYWAGAFANQVCGYFVAADTNGFGGCPMTDIAPGLGYPSGWNDVSVVWGPTQSIGIGAWVGGMCAAVPVQESTWGRIKSVFH